MTPHAIDALSRIQRSVDPVRTFASIMGVKVRQVSRLPGLVDLPTQSQVFYGSTVDRATGTVYFTRGQGVCFRLHEVMHVVCDPPRSRCATPEEWLLLPYERQVMKLVLTSKQLEEAIQLQEGTELQEGLELRYNDDYLESDFWHDGLARGRRLGLLDDEDEPTFKPVNWAFWTGWSGWRGLRALKAGKEG